jgi:hypothetical protein
LFELAFTNYFHAMARAKKPIKLMVRDCDSNNSHE